jgi:hypothetical protein
MKSPRRTEAGPLVHGKVNKREAAVLEFAHQVAVVEWDRAVDGAGLSPTFGAQLPSDALVTDCWIDTTTIVAGGNVTPTVGGTPLTAAQTLGAAAVTKPALTTAAGLKVSGELGATFSGAPSAGKFRLYVAFITKP